MVPTTTPVPVEALAELGARHGLDAIGATRAEPYEATERHIVERRSRGLFGRLRFTMARPERSCHPERVLPGARSVIAGALCYWADAPEPQPGEGRMPRYAWRDAYGDLRRRLEAVALELGGEWRVLVDENDHVDREAAVRAGVGFYGKNTMVITRAHGSWVALGAILTTVEIESSPPARGGCGSCTLCIDACPTDAIVGPGVLDATLCLSTLTQQPDPISEPAMQALGDRVYGCDICQDVCPWNRGVERRRSGWPLPVDAKPTVRFERWLDPGGSEELTRAVERLFVPRNDARWLRRNALVALGNVGGADQAILARRAAAGDDPLLAGLGKRALDLITDRSSTRGAGRR
jgi:epoxyqueuosine reductase